MLRTSVRVTLLVSLLVSTACTQSPAQISMKGQNTYGRSGIKENNQYAYNYAPKPAFNASTSYGSNHNNFANQQVATGPTQQSASVGSIGVSDLAPPQPASTTLQAEDTNSGSVNQWTQKPREFVSDDSDSASKWSAADDAPVKNESLKPSAKGQPVKLITENKDSGFIWPVNSKKIASAYGKKAAGKADDGIRISSAEGEPVWAAADGEVIFVGDELSGYGNMVIVKHSGGRNTTYAHLSQSTVDKYDRVKQGDIIGYVGTTGSVKKPQLYFAVHEGKNAVDPQKYMSRSMAGL